MLPWRRKEVYLGVSMQDFCKVRDLLAENEIVYDYRIVDRNASANTIGGRTPARGRINSPFVDQECTSQYYIYVNKKDYERAAYLINK